MLYNMTQNYTCIRNALKDLNHDTTLNTGLVLMVWIQYVACT
jgi:hypothetical protein